MSTCRLVEHKSGRRLVAGDLATDFKGNEWRIITLDPEERRVLAKRSDGSSQEERLHAVFLDCEWITI